MDTQQRTYIGAAVTFFVILLLALVIILPFVIFQSSLENKAATTCFIILITLATIVVLMATVTKNPTNTTTNNNISTITYTSLGKRGDTGNQMFQIACVVAAAKRSNARLVLPTVLTTLPIAQLFDLTSISLEDAPVDDIYREQDNYEHIQVPSTGLTYDIRGYRQATKYFDDNAVEIRQLFTPRSELLQTMRAVLPSQYIAVHIRRGDYMKTIHKVPLFREFRRCQLAYYQAAIKKLREINPTYPVLICTDSPAWIKPLLPQLDALAVLAPIPSGIQAKFADFCTLYLASSIVISNSTYSWWAAYLNVNREIIAPTPWWDPDGFIGSAYRLHGNWLHFPEMQLLDADTGEPRTVDSRDDDTEPLPLYKFIRGMII